MSENFVKKTGGAFFRVLAVFGKVFGTMVLIGIVTGLIFACIFASYVKNYLSEDLTVNLDEFQLNLSSKIYYTDSDGEVREMATLYSEENRIWLSFDEIPEKLQKACIAIEDKRFPNHNGVDWYRTAGAFVNMFLGMRDTFGASTLTQQLIKNLTGNDDVTVQRKILEIFQALEFEKNYSKDDILEYYLNTIYLGESCWGVGSASYMYFGKPVGELTVAECASLIGITNNPSLYDPYYYPENNKDRQEDILWEMKDQGYLTEAEYQEAIAQELVFQSAPVNEDPDREEQEDSGYYSWFTDAVIEDVIEALCEERGISYEIAEQLLFSAGYQIYATVDMEIQDIVDDIYTDPEQFPTGYVESTYQELQSAIVVIDPYTGDVVAMYGGRGEKEGDRLYNLATDMLRPPGSSLKPVAVYAPAMEYGYIMPYTCFNDSEDVKLTGTDWYPNNDSYSYQGLVTVKQAVRDSINTVAAQIMDLLLPTVAYDFLTERLGVTSLVDGADNSYAPMALGQLTNGISLIELASAYTCFVNDGVYTKARTFTHITDSEGNVIYENTPESHVAISETTAYYITDLLQGVINSGTATSAQLSSGMAAAGKTGASDGWKDRWFVGYTPYYVAAVWSGYETPEYMGSSNPSTILWNKVMERIHEKYEPTEFPIPDGMQRVSVCVDSGMLATDACSRDVRGSRVMTLYMEESAIPYSSCPCHTLVEVCSESYGYLSEDCPPSCKTKMGFIDTSKATSITFVGDLFTNDGEKEPIRYRVTDIINCSEHYRDPATGWYIDSKTGYLINPTTGQLYDPVTGKRYDQYSGWEIDEKTGYIINPETGDLVNPWTGEIYVPPDEPDDESPPPDVSPGVSEPPDDSEAPDPESSGDPSVPPAFSR